MRYPFLLLTLLTFVYGSVKSTGEIVPPKLGNGATPMRPKEQDAPVGRGGPTAGTPPQNPPKAPPPTVSTEKTIGLVKKVPVRPDPNAIGGTCSRYSEVPSKIVIGCGNVELRLEDDKGNEVARTSILHRKFSFSLKEDKIYFLSAVSKEYETVPSRVGPLHRGQVIEIKVKSLSK